MNKLFITIGFFLTLLAQWFVPGQMIYHQEKVLDHGAVYKFKTRPIDPNDPFRGKYVSLEYELNKVAAPKDKVMRGEQVFLYIEQDSLGFAKAVQASKERLPIEGDYVKATATQTYGDNLYFSLPFNRFYMEESKAYDAEVAVRSHSRRTDPLTEACYALVYVEGDTAVLDNVFIGETPLQEFAIKKDSLSN